MKKNLLRPMLVALLTLVGSSAWADTETVTVLSEDYESYEVGDITSTMQGKGWTFQSRNGKNEIKIVQGAEDSANPTKYFDFYYPDGGASRNQSWNLNVESSLTADNWTFSFSAALNPGANNSANKFWVVGTKSGKVTDANADVTNPLLSLIGTAAAAVTYTPSIGATTYETIELTSGAWYDFTITATNVSADASTADITVKIAETGGAIIFEQSVQGMSMASIGTLRGICWNSPRGYSRLSLDNVLLTKEVDASVCAAPQYAITGVAGTARKFTLSCETPGSTIYYATSELEKGAAGWTTYAAEVTTEAATIYAYAEKGSISSEIISFETGAGAAIQLNAPTLGVAELIANGDVYNVKYNATYNAAGVEFTPAATLVATFNGAEVTLPYTVTEDGTLVITANADGYESASVELDVKANYVKGWTSTDYSTLTDDNAATVLGEGWAKSETTGRWASWTADKEPYTYYQYGDGTVTNVTIEENVRIRSVVLLNMGYGLSRNVSGSEAISFLNTTAGTIAEVKYYAGYGKDITEENTKFEYLFNAGEGISSFGCNNGKVLMQVAYYAPKAEEVPAITPAYGTIWEGDKVFPTEGYDVIALSTAYFKDFVKAGDQLVVTLVPKNDEARAEAPRRTIDLGSLALLASDQQTVIAEDDQIDGNADEVVIDIEESWIEQLSTGDFVYLRGQNLRVSKVELQDGTPAEDSELMKEAKELAQDEDAVAVGKLIAAIAEAAETGDESGLQDAIDQFKQDNADQENDQTAKVATNGWKKFDGSAAGVCATQYAPAITTYDGRTAQLAEVYESSVDRTGTIIYQDIAGLENGSYKVGFYGNAFYTSGRGFDSPMAEGAEDVAYVFANDQKAFITAHIATETTENDFREFDVEVTDGTIKLGMGKEQAGTNWHTMQIYRLTWFTTAKEVFAKDQQELAATIAEATALATDDSEGLDELNDAIAAAQLAVGSNWYNIEEVEQIIAELKDAIKTFKNLNLIVPQGKYYVLNAAFEEESFMAAGNHYGTHGIVNATGLDLNLIYNEEADAYNIDTDIHTDGLHFLGSNLYMDAASFNWTIEGEFVYTISAIFDGEKKYIGVNPDGTLTLRDTETEDTQWAFIEADYMDNLRLENGLEAMKGAKEDNPVDATFLLKDADFNRNDHRWVAWTVSDDCTNYNLGGGCSWENSNGCAESYRSTFEISQVVANAPAGTYQLTAQGFYRQENGSTDPAPVFFMNDKTAEVPAITGTENSMNEAGISFAAGSYAIEPIEVTIEDGETLTVGVRNTSNSQWVTWDKFRLTYLGAAATGISEVASDVLATGNEVYNLQGQKVQRAQKGLFIVNGKKVVVK